MALHIVLVEPEIPANTGNIARTCAATGTHLHLVRPLGFRTDDATLKRAGLDYWYAVHIEYHDSFQEVLDQYADSRFYATTKADKCYSELVPGRRLPGLRQRDERAASRADRGKPRYVHAHADDRQGPIAQFVEFGGDHCLRSAAPARFSRPAQIGGGGKACSCARQGQSSPLSLLSQKFRREYGTLCLDIVRLDCPPATECGILSCQGHIDIR